jgi:hypothetical protein
VSRVMFVYWNEKTKDWLRQTCSNERVRGLLRFFAVGIMRYGEKENGSCETEG